MRKKSGTENRIRKNTHQNPNCVFFAGVRLDDAFSSAKDNMVQIKNERVVCGKRRKMAFYCSRKCSANETLRACVCVWKRMGNWTRQIESSHGNTDTL